MTTKKKASKKATGNMSKGKARKIREPGEPIVVGGGPGRKRTDYPVTCDFNHASYAAKPGDDGTKFEHSGWSMKFLEIETALGIVTLKPNGGCEVTIRLQDKGERIYIHGATLGVEFDTDAYPLKTGSTTKHENKKKDHFKTQVDVDFEDKQSISLKNPIRVTANYLVPSRKKKTIS